MSRRIPISTTSQSNQLPNNATTSNNNRSNNQTNNNKNWQTSSLDLVFSFSRSQAFFGSNLPSSPSFVARYRRPNNINNVGGEGDDESQPTTTDRDENLSGRGEGDDREGRTESEERGDESVTTTTTDTDEGSWSEEEDELGERGGERDQGEGRDDLLWEVHHSQEILPRNAVGGTSSTVRDQSGRNRIRRQESSDSSSNNPVGNRNDFDYTNQNQLLSSSNSNSYPQTSPPLSRSTTTATERTHLLVPKTSTTFSPSTPTSTQTQNRRLSIISSSEFWSERIEISRQGKSTYGQTLFNTVNVLVGVGLLALPLSFAESGWLLGGVMLIFCALITNYTAKILARIMARDNTLETYSDVLVKAFGPNARTLIHSMFAFELGAFGIALIILFSDSMATLFPVWDPMSFKLLAFIIILPTTFLPLRFLSITSLIGILSSFTLLFVLISDGLIKKESPGSLWDPMITSISPRWMRFPLSFGLFMSGFSGHAVIPSLVRDMKDPREFDSMINVAYIIATAISFIMGAVGYVMFGNDVSSEITRDMLLNTGFPDVLNKVAMWMIAINPVVKYALISRALSSTLEHLLGIHPSSPISLSTLPSRNPSSLSIQSQVLQDSTINDDNSAIHSEDSSFSVSPLNPFVSPQSRSSPGTTSLNPHHHHQNQKFRKLHNNQDITPVVGVGAKGKSLLHHLISPILLALIILLAILIPDFGRVLSFLGSASAFLICCIGPLIALLILGKKDDGSTNLNTLSNGIRNRGIGEEENLLGLGSNNNSRGRRLGRKNLLGPKGQASSINGGEEDVWIVGSLERGIGWVLLIISIGFCVVGTVWTFLPLDVGLN